MSRPPLDRTCRTPPRARYAVDPVAERRARGVGRHRQDARARRALRQPAARRRRARAHPRDHLHPQGRRRDAAAHHRAAEGGEPAVRSSTPRAGAICKERLGDIAISTIDAFCLSLLREFPLEADVDPGFELADDTEVPRLIGESLDQALRICRAAGARRRRRGAGVRAARRAAAARGLAALLDRRLVAPRRAAPVPARPARSDRGGRVPARGRRGCATSFAGVPRRPGRVPRRRPDAASAVRDAGRRTSRRLCGTPRRRRSSTDRAPARRRSARSIDRLRGYFLTQDGKPRGERFAGTGFKADDCDSDDAWKRHRAAAAQIAPAVADAIRAFRRDLNVVLSRGVWRMFAIALPQYQRTLDAHALLDFSGVLERAVELLKEMDEFAAQPLPARGALSPRARRRVPGHQPRAVGAGARSWCESWGEGLRRRRRRAAAVDLHRRRPQAVDLRLPRRRRRAARRGRARSSTALRPDGEPRRAISVSFRAAPRAARVRQRRVRRDRRRRPARGAARRVPIRRARSVSAVRRRSRARARAGRPDAEAAVEADDVRSASSSATRSGRRRGASPTRSSGCWPARPCATGRPASPRAAQPADIAILFRSRESHREFEARARAARRADLRLQGARLLRRRRDPGRRGAAALSGRSDCRICAPPRFCARASCGCRTTRSRALGAAPRRRAPRPRTAAGSAERLGDGGPAACWRQAARRRAALAVAGRSLPPAELLDARAARDGVRLRDPRTAASAGAREPEEAARPDPPDPEPRLRDAGAHRRSPRAARGRRRVERRDRRASTPSA